MLGAKQERDVTGIPEADILKRAKEKAEENGLAWHSNAAPRTGPYKPLKGLLDESARQKYLDDAKTELLKERGE
jgi:hypothetical protein